MHYWGKVLGLVFGLFSGSGFWGIVIGLIIGHSFDKIYGSMRCRAYFSNNNARQTLFFSTTFQVMGHLTKSKGRVTEVDIHIASLLMDRMQLHGDSRVAAQLAFHEGKQGNYPLRNKLRELRSACFGRFDLIKIFLEIQMQAAFADGILHPNELQVLYVISEELGLSRSQFEQFLRMMECGKQFGREYRYSHAGSDEYAQCKPTLNDAYNVLGVKSSDDIATIKRAYRKLMSEHHPDKLVAKGMPKEMTEMAKQKTQDIYSAYDVIRKEKGFK